MSKKLLNLVMAGYLLPIAGWAQISNINVVSAAGFESQAVAGYAYEFPADFLSGVNHVFTPIAGSPNISFATDSGNSM